MPITIPDGCALIYPPAYANGSTVDSELPYLVAAAELTAATYRCVTLAHQVYDPGEYSAPNWMDITTETTVAGAACQLPPNTTHVGFQMIFCLTGRGQEARVNHRIRVWDGGTDTTGWSETGYVTITTLRMDTPWIDTGRELTGAAEIFKATHKKWTSGWQAPVNNDVYIHPSTHVLYRRNTNYQGPTDPKGMSVYDWTSSRITGSVSISDTDLLGATDVTYVELQVIGDEGSSNNEIYKPLLFSCWAEVRDNGT